MLAVSLFDSERPDRHCARTQQHLGEPVGAQREQMTAWYLLGIGHELVIGHRTPPARLERCIAAAPRALTRALRTCSIRAASWHQPPRTSPTLHGVGKG